MVGLGLSDYTGTIARRHRRRGGIIPVRHIRKQGDAPETNIRRERHAARRCRRCPALRRQPHLLFTWRRQDARSAANGGVEPLKPVPARVDRPGLEALCLALNPVRRIAY